MPPLKVMATDGVPSIHPLNVQMHRKRYNLHNRCVTWRQDKGSEMAVTKASKALMMEITIF